MTSPFEDKSGPSQITRGRRYVLTDDQPGGLSRGKRCQAAPQTAYSERPSPEGAGSTSDTHGTSSLRSCFSSLGSLVASYPPGITEPACSLAVTTGYRTQSPESRGKKSLDYDHVLCDSCVSRLHVLKRQALRLLIHNKNPDEVSGMPLCAIEAWYESDGYCDVCATNLRQLKQKALHTILTQEQTIWAHDPTPSLSSPRPLKRAPGPNTLPRTSSPRAIPAKPALKSSGQGKDIGPEGGPCLEAQWFGSVLQNHGAPLHHHQMPQSTASSPGGSTPTATSIAVSLFVRAVQKLNLSSRRKKACPALPAGPGGDAPSRVTDFCGLLLRSPPLVPRHLLQAPTPGRQPTGPGKGHVKVMLRVIPGVDSCLKVEGRRKQVTVLDPAAHTAQQQTTAFKGTQRSFTFDAVFTPESMQGEVCESALPGALQAVMNGADGCILGFGRAGTGKSYTMTGKDDSILSLGVIPCAISWLFRLVSKRKEKTGADISVSISAIEVYGKNEILRDLLSAEGTGNVVSGQNRPDICFFEDPVSGIQLRNLNMVSAPTAERAATLLDSALSCRSGNRPGGSSHMFFTLHIHQQQAQGTNKELMCGSQSRLILIDLGSCVEEHSKNMAQLSFPELSSVILALLRGSKQSTSQSISNRNTKLAMLLQESLGNVNCQTTVIAHVSGSSERVSDTLSTMQIISRIHKMQRKAKKSRSSSPSERSVHKEKKWLHETKLRSFHSTGTLDPDVPVPKLFRDVRSTSEQSCDTVIHVDSEGCNTDVNKKSQESISIIPSLLKNKSEGGSPVQSMKLRPQRTFLKDFRLMHRSQEEKETKTSGTQNAEMECLKCSTFAELQERLGCIDGSELMCRNQATDSKNKSQPLTEAKNGAEKTDMSKPGSTVQVNTDASSYMVACEANASDSGLTDSFQCDPASHNQCISDKKITDNLRNSTNSRSQTSASESDQYSAESSTCPDSPIRDPLEIAKSQGQSSDDSLLQQEHRISPVGKSSSKSSSSGSSLSSSSMSTSTDSGITLPVTLNDAATPQLSAEVQREMKATITVTVQQPFDLNGQDELVYTVVEEVTISGMAEKGRPTNVISFSEGSSLQSVMPGSQPVRIISSVSDDGSVPDRLAKTGTSETQPPSVLLESCEFTSNLISSNKVEAQGVYPSANVEGFYQPCSQKKEHQTEIPSTMICETTKQVSSSSGNSGGKASLEKLKCGYTPSQDACKKKLEVIKEMPSPAKSMDNPWKACNKDGISNNYTPQSSDHQGVVRKKDFMTDSYNPPKNDTKKSKDLDGNMVPSRTTGHRDPKHNEPKKYKDHDINLFSSKAKLDQKTSGMAGPKDTTTDSRQEKKVTGMKSNQLNKHHSTKGEIMSPASRRRLVDTYDLTRSGSLNSKNHKTASLSRAWHSMDQEDGFEDDYPTSSSKDYRVLGEAMSTPCSPADTLERRRGRSKQGIFARAKENFSSGRRDSPDQKRRANSQSSLPRSPVLHQKSSFFSHHPSDDSCRRKHVRSPVEESSKLFSAKLEQLSNRAPTGHVSRLEYSDFYFSEQDNFTTCTDTMECFESDSTLPRASRSARRYPKFLPMDDGDGGNIKSASKSNLSKVSAVSKLMMSTSKPSNKSSTSGSKTLNLTTRSLRQATRSSSLSPDGTASGFSSWSTQSLSHSQGSSLSSRSSLKIINGRITELLGGSGPPTPVADQSSSRYKEKGAAKDDENLPLPSPYSRVTAPRLPSHCSGHASDTTSILSGELPPAMGKTSLLCNRNSVVSSGYESLMRDSEVTGSSMSIRESISDHSCTHSLARSGRSSKRRSNNSPAGTTQRRPSQETLLSLRRSTSGPRVRWGDRGAADSYEIKVYEIDNVDCLQRRGLSSNRGVACFSAKLKFLEHRQQRIVELRSKYNNLKRELEQAKQHLMLDPDKWTREFDLWQTFEVDSLEHLEALEMVTARLESRVNLCKAHMMMVTSFDAAPRRRQRKAKRHRPSSDQKGFL